MGFKHSRWKRGESIGAGGQARTYHVEDLSGVFTEPCVIKILNDRAAETRYEREIAALRALSHENIMRVLDAAAETDETKFYVMPYAAGGPLSRRAAVYKGNAERTIDVALQLARAAEHAHANGVIHRDIKPENVLFTNVSTDACVLADFGICTLAGTPPVTELEERVGPRYFIAPELDAGDPPTRAADVYSLGKVIYFMITGGTFLPRENHRDGPFDFTLKERAPKMLGLASLLDSTVVQLPQRLPTMTDVIARLERIRRLDATTVSAAVPIEILQRAAELAASDRRESERQEEDAVVRKRRIERITTVSLDIRMHCLEWFTRATELVREAAGDGLHFKMIEDWTPSGTPPGQQRHEPAVSAVMLVRTVPSRREFYLAFSVISRPVKRRDERESADAKLILTPRIGAAGSVGFISTPLHREPDNRLMTPHLSSKFVPRDQGPNATHAFELTLSEWPEVTPTLDGFLPEVLELFLAHAENPRGVTAAR